MEFVKEYWWCFLVLAIVIIAVIVALVFGAKQTKKETITEEKVQKVEDTKQEKVEKASVQEKGENVEKSKKEDATPKKEKTEEKPKTENVKAKEEKVTATKENKKADEKAKEEKVEEKMERKQKYMVIYDKENKDWVVKKTDSSRASKRCKTKAEALEVATRLSESQDLSLTVKKKDGKFQKQR